MSWSANWQIKIFRFRTVRRLRSGASSHLLFLRPSSNYLRGIFGWRGRLKGHHTISRVIELWSEPFASKTNLSKFKFASLTADLWNSALLFLRRQKPAKIFLQNCQLWTWFTYIYCKLPQMTLIFLEWNHPNSLDFEGFPYTVLYNREFRQKSIAIFRKFRGHITPNMITIETLFWFSVVG